MIAYILQSQKKYSQSQLLETRKQFLLHVSSAEETPDITEREREREREREGGRGRERERERERRPTCTYMYHSNDGVLRTAVDG